MYERLQPGTHCRRQSRKDVRHLGDRVDRVGDKVDRIGDKLDRVGDNVNRDKLSNLTLSPVCHQNRRQVGDKVESIGDSQLCRQCFDVSRYLYLCLNCILTSLAGSQSELREIVPRLLISLRLIMIECRVTKSDHKSNNYGQGQSNLAKSVSGKYIRQMTAQIQTSRPSLIAKAFAGPLGDLGGCPLAAKSGATNRRRLRICCLFSGVVAMKQQSCASTGFVTNCITTDPVVTPSATCSRSVYCRDSRHRLQKQKALM